MLQIEIYRWVGSCLSKSVTRGTNFAELLLQIEIFWQTGPVYLDL